MIPRFPALLPAAVAGLLALVAGALVAQPTLDRLTTGFEINGDYLVQVDGSDLPRAEVFYSSQAGAFLVLATDVLPSPVMLWPRTGSVQTIEASKVNRRADGTVDVLSEAPTPAGSFRVVGGEVTFTVDGHDTWLRQRPYLLGPQTGRKLVDANPAYAHGAEAYRPSEPVIEELRGSGADVKVEVYFGSWCPACKQMVPRIVRVADELDGSSIAFEFYGLPKPFAGEPRAEDRGITAVPTGIVFKDGQEVGRISGNDWRMPELAIQQLVG